MVDIHCHLLYGVDDGAKTIEESAAMLQEAKNQGISAIILTPHYRHGFFAYPKEEIEEHDKYDIWHGLKCEFIRVGTQESVTGTIVNIFCAGGIRHFASNVEKTKEFSMRLYNKLTNTKYYDIDEELSQM